MIAVVTDSNSQLPPALADRFGIAVVPLPVTVDGTVYLEGVDLDADDFYARFEGRVPEVATAQPSPGQFGAAYAAAVGQGATAILSVHIGSSVSGTVNSARLAADHAGVPVRIVDTGTASFAVALCAWAGAEAVAAGATLEEADAAASAVAGTVGNVFVVRALDLARAGGRLDPGAGTLPTESAVPVLTMVGGTMQVVGRADDLDQVADLMAGHVRAAGTDLRVGVGVADTGVAHLWDELERRLTAAPEVSEVVRYRVGPSVGVHTGPGTVGVMYAPRPPGVRERGRR